MGESKRRSDLVPVEGCKQEAGPVGLRLVPRGDVDVSAPEPDLAPHVPALRAAARALCRNSADCEDLVQDTFVRALGHLAGDKQPVRNLRAWLVAILRNAFIDRVRAERSAEQDVEDCPAPEPDPQPPWASVTLADVRAACAALDPDLRAVFELHYLGGLRYRDIAARLSIPVNTVASRLFRCRKELRALLLATACEEERCEEERCEEER